MESTETLVVVRCPYCVAGAEFSPMTLESDGKLVCRTCGHTASGEASYECSCERCSRVDKFLGFTPLGVHFPVF